MYISDGVTEERGEIRHYSKDEGPVSRRRGCSALSARIRDASPRLQEEYVVSNYIKIITNPSFGASRMNTETMRERYVGNRYYNTEINEGFAVVGIKNDLLILQYHDGTEQDEDPTPSQFKNEQIRELVNLAEDGIEDTKYVQLPGGGPTLQHACRNQHHDYYPLPSDLNITTYSEWQAHIPDYNRIVRCRKCGLSADVISTHLQHDTPGFCARCNNEINPIEEARAIYSPVEGWEDLSVCTLCASDLAMADTPCADCGTNIESPHPRHHYPADGPVAETLNTDLPHDKSIYICDDCQTDR